jgi:transposase
MTMPAAVRIEATDEQHAALEERFEQTCDAETRLRYQMVLLASTGYTAPQIAPLVRRSEDTVLRVLRRYREAGVEGVPHRPRPGRPVQVPPAWEAELRRVIEEDPHTVGVKSANWTTQLLADYLHQVTGHRTGIETVRVHLHAADYVCKRPTWTLQRKAQEQEGWAKNA